MDNEYNASISDLPPIYIHGKFPNKNEEILWKAHIGAFRDNLFPSWLLWWALAGLPFFLIPGIAFIEVGFDVDVGIFLIFLYFVVLIVVPVMKHSKNVKLAYNAYAMTKDRAVEYNQINGKVLAQCVFKPNMKIMVVNRTVKFLNSENQLFIEFIDVPDPDGVANLAREFIAGKSPD